MKKKNIVMIVGIILLVIFLFPIPIQLKDGGTTEYKALLYKLTDYHKFGTDTEYIEGIKIEILGKEIFNNTIMHHIEKNPETDKRVKLKDLKITAENVDTTKLVQFDNILYGKSNALIDYAGDFTKTIGKINFLIGEEYMPSTNGETNCKELLNSSVLEANEKSMVLNVNHIAVLFEAIEKENRKKSNGESFDIIEENYSSFVGTVLEETTSYMIVEPNEDEEERKSSDKIKINYGTNHMDYLYGIGRKVVIFYNGFIMESYPAQINTNRISTDGYEDFEIKVKLSDKMEKKKILNNKDLSADKQDYHLYFYGLDEVHITINEETMSLEDALKSGKMTIHRIIQRANKDFPDAISYDDGGSVEYHYKDYSIIKFHKLDGNRDVYIGVPGMKLKDLKR